MKIISCALLGMMCLLSQQALSQTATVTSDQESALPNQYAMGELTLHGGEELDNLIIHIHPYVQTDGVDSGKATLLSHSIHFQLGNDRQGGSLNCEDLVIPLRKGKGKAKDYFDVPANVTGLASNVVLRIHRKVKLDIKNLDESSVEYRIQKITTK